MSLVVNDAEKRITNPYGNGHKGVDIGWRSNEAENEVWANCAGEVVEVQDGLGNIPGVTGVKSWGNYVYIKHPNGMYTRYAHLKSGIHVSVGDKVNALTSLGIIGNSGNANGRHLHFEVSKRYDSRYRIDPTPYLTKPVYDGEVEEVPQPTPETFKVGDKVVPLTLVDYNGTRLIQYDPYYFITELSGNRAVLSANRGGKYYCWAAMNTNNIKKI